MMRTETCSRLGHVRLANQTPQNQTAQHSNTIMDVLIIEGKQKHQQREYSNHNIISINKSTPLFLGSEPLSQSFYFTLDM